MLLFTILLYEIFSNVTSYCISKGNGYSTIEFGHDCAPDAIIKERGMCNDALRVLGIPVTSLDVVKTSRPAGCYWRSGNKGYFNSIVDSSLTQPSLFGERGGVCRDTGTILKTLKQCEEIKNG